MVNGAGGGNKGLQPKGGWGVWVGIWSSEVEQEARTWSPDKG